MTATHPATDDPAATVHASAVLVGARALLIRGPSAAGKSSLALSLLLAAQSGLLPFVRLVGDDRVHLEAHHGRLLVRPADALAGLIEVRGLGIRRVPHEPVAVVGMVVDLAASDAERMAPEPSTTTVCGIELPRLAVADEADALNQVLALVGAKPLRPRLRPAANARDDPAR
jgi:serine kinase of HPr protein (carbohydrate metabolism regulator)